jgi:hypothetical protein
MANTRFYEDYRQTGGKLDLYDWKINSGPRWSVRK